jgi:energy-converting hydrogenase Eha subunit C
MDSDVMTDDEDAMIMDDDISGATTEPATSYNSISDPPPRIQQPSVEASGERANMEASEWAPAHTKPIECGGLDMSQLKEAMSKESAAQEPLVDIIGALLDKTVQRNDLLKRVSQLHDFESDRICSLSAAEYLSRIMRYGKCSPSCAVVGLIYLQRIKTKVPSACVTSRNLQRLLLVAVLLANKFLDDLYYSNKHWAKIGGISLQEINHLELSILRLLDWKMMVTREQYLEYLDQLGCGPPAVAADTESWANELLELKHLVATGAGIRLYSDGANLPYPANATAVAGMTCADDHKQPSVHSREADKAAR